MGAPIVIALMKPPSPVMSWPVIQRAAGDPRNEITGTMSSTLACRPTVARHMSRTSLPMVFSKSERIGVSTGPGLTVLLRTPYLVHAGPARRLLYRITASFDVLYTG